jgi:hypothetical protein
MTGKLRYVLTLKPARSKKIGGFGIIVAAVLALIVQRMSPTDHLSRRVELATTFGLIGLHLDDFADHQDVDCQHFAKRQLARYLKDHPCRRMDRELVTVHDDAGHCIVVSILWVELPDNDAAAGFAGVYRAGDIGTWGSARLHVGEPDLIGAAAYSRVPNALVTESAAVGCGPAGAAADDIDKAAAVAVWFSRP